MRPRNTYWHWMFGLMLIVIGWYVQSWWGAMGLMALMTTIEDEVPIIPLHVHRLHQRKGELR